MEAIQAQELSKTYAGGAAALRGVSFSVSAGEIFAYLGRNGQGKTTTVRILATLTAATGGHASVAGHDVAAAPGAVRRSIGVTMQAAALDGEMTGREHLVFLGRLWGMGRAVAVDRAAELIAWFELKDAADRPIGTYSGGMRRRVDLAGALVARPSVLFLDEPTTGLDVQSRRALWAQVRAFRDAGTTVFLTTQYLEEADVLADRVAIIEGGRIVAIDSPASLKAATRSSSLEEAFLRLTGAEPDLTPVLAEGA
jgi:ABC-2 type transport system ATP-binding protein